MFRDSIFSFKTSTVNVKKCIRKSIILILALTIIQHWLVLKTAQRYSVIYIHMGVSDCLKQTNGRDLPLCGILARGCYIYFHIYGLNVVYLPFSLCCVVMQMSSDRGLVWEDRGVEPVEGGEGWMERKRKFLCGSTPQQMDFLGWHGNVAFNFFGQPEWWIILKVYDP